MGTYRYQNEPNAKLYQQEENGGKGKEEEARRIPKKKKKHVFISIGCFSLIRKKGYLPV